MGGLTLVPTPIGNLEDITLRALETLKSADLILAEDTRKSGKLLKHFDISTPMQSHHLHNEHKTLAGILDKLERGMKISLISDAGTPGIADPGYLLTRACIDKGIEVSCLPGATAIIPALAVSGLPSHNFVFEGFLPVKKGRKSRLEFLINEERTMIFYEAPHKLLKTLKDFVQHFGAARQVSVSRELTKLYEETVRGTLGEVLVHFENNPPKGEFVLVVAGNPG